MERTTNDAKTGLSEQFQWCDHKFNSLIKIIEAKIYNIIEHNTCILSILLPFLFCLVLFPFLLIKWKMFSLHRHRYSIRWCTCASNKVALFVSMSNRLKYIYVDKMLWWLFIGRFDWKSIAYRNWLWIQHFGSHIKAVASFKRIRFLIALVK